MTRTIFVILISHLILVPLTASAAPSLAAALVAAAPAANSRAIELAVAAVSCAEAQGTPKSRRLAVIDYSRPSTEPRLWIFDLVQRKLLYRELVAHGRNSGDNHANRFSNEMGSFQSSLGLFRTQETYVGRHGYSLRMDGLETGINDRARERAIVMHGAPYVDGALSASQGRIGRSLGCPALRTGIAKQVIDTLKGGQFLFSYYPDRDWLASSSYLRCSAARSVLATAAR